MNRVRFEVEALPELETEVAMRVRPSSRKLGLLPGRRRGHCYLALALTGHG
jgi:hypothetical protein